MIPIESPGGSVGDGGLGVRETGCGERGSISGMESVSKRSTAFSRDLDVGSIKLSGLGSKMRGAG